MTSSKATALFLFGTIPGFGTALVVVAHLLNEQHPLKLLGSLNIFLEAVLHIAVGLVGGVGIAMGDRRWRLRTLLGEVAVLAILLGVTVELRRRAERFERLGYVGKPPIAS